MHKPFKHTLTPTDRIIVEKWLVGAFILFGAITFLIIGFAMADHHSALTAANETAAVQSGSLGELNCRGSRQADNTFCGHQIDRSGRR